MNKKTISDVMREMGRKGGKKGGKRRLETLTDEQRAAIAKKAAAARWADRPAAKKATSKQNPKRPAKK
jgi:hypothetical protein